MQFAHLYLGYSLLLNLKSASTILRYVRTGEMAEECESRREQSRSQAADHPTAIPVSLLGQSSMRRSQLLVESSEEGSKRSNNAWLRRSDAPPSRGAVALRIGV